MRIKLLSAVVSLAVSLSATAANYSQMYVFGDSLSDSGTYLPAVQNAFGGGGRFTTNPGPIWVDFLGSVLHRPIGPASVFTQDPPFTPVGGTNYAQGGARVTLTPGYPPTNPFISQAQPVDQQIDLYLGGGRADPRALYAVWAGANDIFALADAVPGAQSPEVVAQELAAQVARLSAAGARTILVFSLPDIGRTPDAAASGVPQLFTNLSLGFNEALQAALLGQQLNVVYVDIRALLDTALTDPARFGFTNTTSPACNVPSLLCQPANLVSPNAAQTYIFADGVHPTTATHQIIADYSLGLLRAPEQIGRLAAVPTESLNAQWRGVDNRLRDFQSGFFSGSGGFYLNLDRSSSDQDGDSTSPSLSGDGTSGTIGYDHQLGGHALVGGALGYGSHSLDYGHSLGGFDYDGLALSGYGALRFGDAYVNLTASYTWLDYDTKRRTPLGIAQALNHASPSGSQWGARLGGGYNFKVGNAVTGPLASYAYQRVEVDAFSEQGDPLTAMRFSSQDQSWKHWSLGWQAYGKLSTQGINWAPFVQLSYENTQDPGNRSVTAGILSSPMRYSLPVSQSGSEYGLGLIGARIDLSPLQLYLSASSSFSRSEGNASAFNLMLGLPL